MHKKLFIVSIVALSYQTITLAQTPGLSPGVSVVSQSATTGAANGTSYSTLSSSANFITWQVVFSTPPAVSHTTVLQGSFDNLTWFTLDTNTATTGGIRNVQTSVPFVRTITSAQNGGGTITTNLISKAVPTNSVGLNSAVTIPGSPSIASGFGSSASIVSTNGALTFRVNVGTGGVATSGVVTMPTATTGWNCLVQDMTTAARETRQTDGNTTSITVTAASAWVASDILVFQCLAY